MSQDDGFSLLELMISLSIVSIVSVVGFSSLKASHKIRPKKSLALEILKDEITKGVRKSETFYAIDSLKIYEDAKELSKDAKVASSAITFLHLAPVIFKKVSRNKYCSDGDAIKADYFLALDLKKKERIKEKAKKIKNCIMINTDYPYLIPEVDHYSLYLDRKNRIKRFSHQTNYKHNLIDEISDFKVSEDLEIKISDVNSSLEFDLKYGDGSETSILDIIK